MSIIQTLEVIRYSVVDREFGTDKINQFKSIIESDYIRNILGSEFYETLKGVAVDWSGVNEWNDDSTPYANNSIVYWKGSVFKSTTGTNNEEPGYNATNWIEAPRFTVSEFSNLWKNHLAIALSNRIVLDTAILNTYKASAKGLTVSTEDNSNVATLAKDEMFVWEKQVKNIIDKTENEMIYYIKSQNDKYRNNPATGYNYSEVSFIDGTDEEIKTNNKVKRRFSLRY